MSQYTAHQRVHLSKSHGSGFHRPSRWLTLQEHFRYREYHFYRLLQEAFLSIFSHQGNLEPYRDPLWTSKSLPYLEFHNRNCAILFALLRRKVATFFSFFPFSPKPINNKERDAQLHLLPSSLNCGKNHLVLCSTPGTTAPADWVVRGFPLAATPAPLEADVLLSGLDFIHSEQLSMIYWHY